MANHALRVSLVTIATADREGYLWRLLRQAPWVRAYEWIIAGPPVLRSFCQNAHAIHIPCDVTHGTGRNLCAERATGDVLVHIDDDDWQAPDRVARQVFALERPMPGDARARHPEVVGSTWLYCLDTTRGGVASRISWWDNANCLVGATLAYYREAWRLCPFAEVGNEDGPFCSFFKDRGTLFDMHDPKLLVYMRSVHTAIHGDWWYESRTRERKRSARDLMLDRLKNPGASWPVELAETPRDLALLHEEEAATVYVKWMMGADFDRYVRAP
jgi:glycosyltransferase involved in cell wall biosynthesis